MSPRLEVKIMAPVVLIKASSESTKDITSEREVPPIPILVEVEHVSVKEMVFAPASRSAPIASAPP